MEMSIVKSCPKCRSNVYRYFSIYDGWHEECFRCGYRNMPESVFKENIRWTKAIMGKPREAPG